MNELNEVTIVFKDMPDGSVDVHSDLEKKEEYTKAEHLAATVLIAVDSAFNKPKDKIVH